MILRMMSALRGTSMPREFSTARTLASACTVVHDAADAFAESPRITWVAALQDHFQAAPHGARTHRVANLIVIVEHRLHPEVAFNSRNRIDYDSLCHGSLHLPVGVVRI